MDDAEAMGNEEPKGSLLILSANCERWAISPLMVRDGIPAGRWVAGAEGPGGLCQVASTHILRLPQESSAATTITPDGWLGQNAPGTRASDVSEALL